MRFHSPALATCLFFAAACNRGPVQSEPAPTVSPEVRAAAAAFYKERCGRCHGAAGRGDGPDGLALPIRPQNLADRMWQSNVTNERLRKVLIHGGGAVGKSGLMPPTPELAGRPDLCDGLVAQIRGFPGDAPR
jgi:mono/diheme cytochrome c family protein